MFKYGLGLEAEDIITGFKGIIIYRVNFLTGCAQYGIQPTVDNDGKSRDSLQVDENRIRILGNGVTEDFKQEKKKVEKGGLQPVIRQSRT